MSTMNEPQESPAPAEAHGDRVRAALERFCDATACIPMPGERVTTTMVQTLGMALSEARAALEFKAQPKGTEPVGHFIEDFGGEKGRWQQCKEAAHYTVPLFREPAQAPAPSQPKGAEPVYRRRTDAEALDCANRLNRSFPPSSLKDEAADHIRELVAVVQSPAPAPELAHFDGCVMVGYSRDRGGYCVYEETAPGEYCAIKGPFKTKAEAESAMRDPNAPTILQAAHANSAGEAVASIYISADGSREFDDWGHDLPQGRNVLYTAPRAQPENQAPAVGADKLWLWKNFVDGRPEYWAFDNPFPVHMDGGDPQTLGEPCGYALFKPSRVGRTDVPEAEVIRRIKAAKPAGDEVLEALRKLDKAAMDVVWAQNQHDARVAVHWLSEAAKQSHAVIAKADADSHVPVQGINP